jgi:hypothetical protein
MIDSTRFAVEVAVFERVAKNFTVTIFSTDCDSLLLATTPNVALGRLSLAPP